MDTEIIKLLFISAQHSQANQLLACLRNEGLALQSMGLNASDNIEEQLKLRQWDLIVCFESDGIEVASVLATLKQEDLNTPLIFIALADSDKPPLEALTLGARDVISGWDKQKILFAIKREVSSYRVIKDNRRLSINLKELEKSHHLLLNSARDAFSYIHEGMHIYCNQSYVNIFAYDSIEHINTTPLLDLVIPEDSLRLKELLSSTITHDTKITLKALQADGKKTSVEMTFSPVRYDSENCLQLCVHFAHGNNLFAEQKKEIQSQDLLTRLYNKTYFMQKIEEAIGGAIELDILSSLLIIQVNEFVDIQTTIGKSNTNIMLNDIAQFLQNAIKKSFSAARLDDDVFGLLLDNSNPQEAIELAEFIQGKVNNYITSAVLPSIQLSCSIGIAVINVHALDAEDILSKAEVNLNALPSKQNIPGEFHINGSMEHQANEMISYLKLALKENRFKLLFQPLVNIKSNGANGYEILTRMLDSDNNDISPNNFIPLANLNGMGEDIDKAVLSSALQRIQEVEPSPYKFIITLTNNSLVSPTFLPWLSEKLQALKIPSDSLIIQISEIDITNSLKHTIQFCEGLDELGLNKAVCHFGCSIKPLEYLQTIQPNYVKLDKTIIRDIAYSSHQKNSVQDLILDIHSKGFKVAAPQIEELNLLPLLWEIGIDFAQGYCLQEPSQDMNYDFIQNQEITLNAAQENISN